MEMGRLQAQHSGLAIVPPLILALGGVVDAEHSRSIGDETGVARAKRRAFVSTALEQRDRAFAPGRRSQRVAADKVQKAQSVVACPAAIGTVDYAAETRHVKPRGAFVDAAATTFGSFPGQFGTRDACEGVVQCSFWGGKFDDEQILLRVRVVAQRPARVTGVESGIDDEDGQVDVPVIRHPDQRTQE